MGPSPKYSVRPSQDATRILTTQCSQCSHQRQDLCKARLISDLRRFRNHFRRIYTVEALSKFKSIIIVLSSPLPRDITADFACSIFEAILGSRQTSPASLEKMVNHHSSLLSNDFVYQLLSRTIHEPLDGRDEDYSWTHTFKPRQACVRFSTASSQSPSIVVPASQESGREKSTQIRGRKILVL